MKKYIFLTLLTTVFILVVSAQPTDFITKWNLATSGSGPTQLSFGVATSGTVSYTWQEVSPGSASGSGTFSGSTLTITGLPAGSVIRVKISPTNFERIIISYGPDRHRLINVEQWGSISWMSMAFAFIGCGNLNITASDIPDLSNVISMSHMFMDCPSLNGPSNIGSWNTGLVTDLSAIFQNAYAFSQNLGAWSLNSNVNLQYMFNNSGMSCANYSATLMGWSNNPATPSGRSLGAGGRQYGTAAVAARTNLTTTKGWTISGDAASGTDCTAFITTWKTDNPGTSNSTSITIPTNGSGYNYDVDWNNDGVYDETALTGNVTHNFGIAGTYTIRIRGNFPRIYFNNVGDKAKFLNISQWGSIAWTSMSRAFLGCSNLNITATDVPDLTGVTDMSLMFATCTSLNGPSNIGSWNTVTITNMSQLFSNATSFNQPIGNWNTSSVTDMSFLFNGATAFNQSLDNWNTGSVVTMERMFYQATTFNASIGSWNTAAVNNMLQMFASAISFNQPIGSWNTAAVTNMSNMFNNATAFNQPVGNWNTSAVTSMNSTFWGASSFNQPLANWNTAACTYMYGMFYGTPFNQPIGNWDVHAVTSFNQMFASSAFNQPIGNWNTASVNSVYYMFYNSAFNQPIGNWNTAAVNNMRSMFEGNSSFNQPIGNWNTAAVSDMGYMFSGASAFNQNLGSWTLRTAGVNLSYMLNSSGMNCANYSATLVGWSKNPLTPSSRNLGAAGRQYNYTGLAARNYLVTTKGWTIADAGNGATSTLGGTTGGAQVCQNVDVSLGRMYTDGCNSLLMITPNGASPVSGNINACVKIDNAVPFYSGEAYLQRHFDITPANNPATATARITLYVLQSEFDAFNLANVPYYPDLPAGPNDAAGKAALRITTYSGTGTAPGNYIPGTATLINPDDADIVWNGYHWEISFNVTGFSGFYIHAPKYNSPLPVNLLSFSGYKDGSRNQLRWTTASEANNKGFDIQRSTDGVMYNSIGFVNSLAAGGNSNEQITYSFTDNNPPGNTQFYRLRQVDMDDNSKLSSVIVIKGDKPASLEITGLYPNPASTILQVAVSSPLCSTVQVQVQVFDMTGRLVGQQLKMINEGSNTITLHVASLASGRYMLKLISADNEIVTIAFIKQ